MEPVHYIRILIRRWPVLLICVVIAAIPAWIAAPAESGPPVRTFVAKTTLIRDVDSGLAGAKTSLATAALLATTGEVPLRVAEAVGWTGDPAVLAAGVSTLTDTDVGSLVIEVENPDGARAALLANTFGAELKSYLAELAEATRQGAVDQIVTRLEELQRSIEELDRQVTATQNAGQPDDLIRAQRDAQVRQYSVAYERMQQLAASQDFSTSPSGFVTLEDATPIPIVEGGFTPPSSRPGRLAGAAVIGLLVGSVIVLAREQIYPRIRSKESGEAAFGLPVLAEVPKLLRGERHRLAVMSRPRSQAADAYRIVRTSLHFLPARSLVARAVPEGAEATSTNGHGPGEVHWTHSPRMVLITSSIAREGKTTLTANLAAALAEAGRKVLIVDADLRRPRQHQQLGVELGRGLLEVLRDDSVSIKDVVRATSIDGVSLVTAGQPVENPAELIMRSTAWVDEARELADVVLVDTGPVLESNEATDLIPFADALLLAAQVGTTKTVAARRTSEVLARLNAPVLGVVLIGASTTTQPWRRRAASYRGMPRDVGGRPGPGGGGLPGDPPPPPRPRGGAPAGEALALEPALAGAREGSAVSAGSVALQTRPTPSADSSGVRAQAEQLARAVAAHGLPGSTTTLPDAPLEPELWYVFLRQCQWQRLTGPLLSAIDASELPVSDEQRVEAHSAHREAMAQVLQIERVLLRCHDMLTRAGIDHRVLKGPIAARLDYADPSLRAFGDLDLLVRPDQWDAACDTLAAAGFTRLHPEPRPGFDSRFSKGTTFRTAGGWEVDLHRTFVLGPFGLTVDLADVWADAVEVDVAGHRVLGLGAEVRFLNACFHAALGDVPPRLVPLRDIAEMHLGGRQPLDLDAVVSLARRWHAEVPVARAVNLCWETLGLRDTTALSVWAGGVRDDKQQKTLEVYLDRRVTNVALLIANVRAVTGLRNKLDYVRALALPDPEYTAPRHATRRGRWKYAAGVVRRRTT